MELIIVREEREELLLFFCHNVNINMMIERIIVMYIFLK
jgi:hypothetical protein